MEKKISIEEKNSMEDGNHAEEAVGLLEVFGLVCAFMANLQTLTRCRFPFW